MRNEFALESLAPTILERKFTWEELSWITGISTRYLKGLYEMQELRSATLSPRISPPARYEDTWEIT